MKVLMIMLIVALLAIPFLNGMDETREMRGLFHFRIAPHVTVYIGVIK